MQVATAQGRQSHRVGEFQVKQTAVGFDQSKGMEPARCAAIVDLATIGPVHLELFPSREFDPDENLNGTTGTDLVQMGIENTVAPLIAQRTQPVENALAAQLGILNQPLLNQGAERIQLAFPLALFLLDDRTQGILADRLAVQTQVLSNLADAPLFDLRKLVDGMNFCR